MKKILLLLFLIPNLVTAASAFEERNSSNPFNIVILPFKLIGDDMPNQSIEEIIRDDLNKSGYFYASTSGLLGDREINLDVLSIYSSKDAVVYGEIRKQNDDIYDLDFYVVDTTTKKMLYQRRLAVHQGSFRKIGHILSDKVYEIFIDATGSYETKLAYVTVSEHANGDKIYRLEISDSDGYNPQTLVKSSKPILSPSWSPDQNQIAYISFKNDQVEAFVKNPYDKSLPIMLPKLDGIAAEPSWHPNGESVLLTLSYNEGYYKGFNQDIYSYNLNSKKLERLTTHISVDTEANYSPDGRSIVFTSLRNGGKKQIFIKNLDTEVLYRVPVNSPYLSDPVFSPDGTKLAFIQEINGNKRLTLYDIKSNTQKILTKNRQDNSPSFSPSGEWLIFATTRSNKKILSIISLPLNQIVELISKNASVIEPTWLNFGKKYQSSFDEDELFANLVKVKEQESSVIVPLYAYESSDPIGWTCIPEYVKVGNYCYIKIENGYYNASGDVVCNTGYIWQSNKYFVMTCQRDEKFVMDVDFWNSIKDSNDPEEYRFYLLKYPDGEYAALAEYRIEKLSDTTIPDLDYGDYHALVIGNDRYRHLKPLSNAVNDANAVASLLRSKYQFNVNVLTDATRDEIVSALSSLRKTITSKDNLLVYYAGHGWLDKDMDEGYWLPVDAVDDDLVHWIANSTIINSVRAMKAKHVLVVADSCFSGTLIRGIKIRELSSDYLKEIVEKKSRTVLTSGGLEPVSDVGGGNNSVFAAAFMRILNENTGVMDGHQFFTTLRRQVMTNADQTPEYGDIRKAGHKGGDFLFVRQ